MKKQLIVIGLIAGIMTSCSAAKEVPPPPEMKWGYIDTTGAYVVEPRFDDASAFTEGLAAVAEFDGKDRKCGYIDSTGEYAIGPKFSDCGVFAGNGLAPVCVYDKSGRENTEKWGYIDKAGEFVIEPQFKWAGSFCEGLAAASVEMNGKELWGYIDDTGAFVIEPQFDDAHEFAENGLAAVRTGGGYGTGRYGYIDKSGKFVIEPRFYSAGNFDRYGLADVCTGNEEGGTWTVIDKSGEQAADISARSYAFDAVGFTTVHEDHRIGYADEDGKTVIEPQFDAAYGFSENGLAAVGVRTGK